MIKGKYTYFESEESKAAFEIRKAVFEPLALPDRDDIDSIAVHGIVYFNETLPVATGRIAYLDSKFKMSRLAVLPDFQRKKIGDFLVRMLVDKVFCSGAKEVFTDAPADLLSFFSSIGFKNCDTPFELEGITYQPMSLKLESFRTGCGHAYCPSLKK